jgi:ribonuclease HI
MTSKIIINVDGASRGNPGSAAIGVTLKDEKSRLVATISEIIGRKTNNQAEYMALIAGLRKAISLGIREVEVGSDSELIVKQILGRYRVKNKELKVLYDEAMKLVGSMGSFVIKSIPREENKEADKLANQALDAN